MRRPDLSIIIVNWNSAEFLGPCLNSIFAAPRPFMLEVLLLDNASYDGSAAMIEARFPGVKFMQSRINLGFAAANNLAFSYSHGRNILFLNPDTEIVGNALSAMLEALTATSNAGLVGPRLVNADGSVQAGCIRTFPSVLNELFNAEVLRGIFAKVSSWSARRSTLDSGRLLATEVVPGACVMVRREVFEALGGFREDYFMYGEDLDLSYEAQCVGWQNYYVPEAVVIHYGGESSRKREAGFAPVLMRQSMADFLRAKRGHGCAAAYRALTALAAIVRMLIIAPLLLLSRNREERGRRRSILRKWASILRWTLGLERWASQQSSQAGPGASTREPT